MTAKCAKWQNMKRALRDPGWLSVGLLALAVLFFLLSLPPLLALRDFRRSELESYTGCCRVERSRFDRYGNPAAYTFTLDDGTPLIISEGVFSIVGMEENEVLAMGSRSLTYTYSGNGLLGYALVSVADGEDILISANITWMERERGDGWFFTAVLCLCFATAFYVRPLYRDLRRRHRSRPPRLR